MPVKKEGIIYMRLVSYVPKEERFNVESISQAGARLAWWEKEWIIDIPFACTWVQQQKEWLVQRWPHTLHELLNEEVQIWHYLRETYDLLTNQDIAQLHVAGEPLAISQTDVELLSPYIPTALYREGKTLSVADSWQLSWQQIKNAGGGLLTIAWAALVGMDEEGPTIKGYGLVCCFQPVGQKEQLYLAPPILTADEVVLSTNQTYCLTIDGQQVQKGRLSSPIELSHRPQNINCGDVLLSPPLHPPYLWDGISSFSWEIESFGSVEIG